MDADGYWLGPYVDFLADTLELDFYKEMESKKREFFAKENELMKERSVIQNLIEFNTWESIQENNAYYNQYAIRVKDSAETILQSHEMYDTIDGQEHLLRTFDYENIGVELVAEWYKRNMIIYRNIKKKKKKGDIILVIFGQGHIRILHHLLEDNPNYKIVDPLIYLFNEV